jgi:hypothetical protein
MPQVNEAVVATYLAGGNTRRIRGALQPLLKAAPLSKSAVSRVVSALQSRGERANQIAQNRRLAEDRHRAHPAHVGGGMMIARADSADSAVSHDEAGAPQPIPAQAGR